MPDLIAISHQHAPGSSFVNLSDKPKPSPVPESSRPLLCDVPSAVQAVAQTYQSQSADISVLVKHLLASMAVSVDDDVCTLQKLTMSQSQCSIWQKHRAGVSLRYPESKKNVTYYVFWLCFIHFRELVRPFVHASVRASQNIVDISWYLERYRHFHQTYNNDKLWDWDKRINYWGKKINSHCHSIFWKHHCSGGCIKHWTIIYRLRVCGYVIRNRYNYPHTICFELYVSVEMYRRLLFEISKLSIEVQQLWWLIERQSCWRCNGDTGTVIPELACGPCCGQISLTYLLLGKTNSAILCILNTIAPS